jgi:adenylate cyclase
VRRQQAGDGDVVDIMQTGAAPDAESLRFAEAAIARGKREGLRLAIRARTIGLVATAVMLPLINPHPEVVYYLGLLVVAALLGLAQWRVGRAGLSMAELALIVCDLALVTLIGVLDNPLTDLHWPNSMQVRSGIFVYFFLLLATGTLAYSWRTVLVMGAATCVLWGAGLLWVHAYGLKLPALGARIAAAIGNDPRLFALIDPNAVVWTTRVQEMVVFLLVALTLAITVRRGNNLLISHAASERERTNLARYFSPNVVDELSRNDGALREVRSLEVAVMFVDLVGFTAYADDRAPEEVIGTLRAFHAAMEREVFRHGGTLDKYLGDGLMATFGTPFSGPDDATNALRCARAMIAAMAALNATRRAAGEPALQVSVGVHFGPVVLGDLGVDRLEFAVIGHTVNTASRLEALTRGLGCQVVASDALVQRLGRGDEDLLAGFTAQPPQPIRGVAAPVAIWAWQAS